MNTDTCSCRDPGLLEAKSLPHRKSVQSTLPTHVLVHANELRLSGSSLKSYMTYVNDRKENEQSGYFQRQSSRRYSLGGNTLHASADIDNITFKLFKRYY